MSRPFTRFTEYSHDQEPYDHIARVRDVVAKKIASMPVKDLLLLQELAYAIEHGEDLSIVLERKKIFAGRKDPTSESGWARTPVYTPEIEPAVKRAQAHRGK